MFQNKDSSITISNCVVCGHQRNPDDVSSHGLIRGNTSRFLDQKFPLWKCPHCATIHSLSSVDFADIYKDYPPNLFQSLDYFARGRFFNLLRRLKKAGLKKHHRILDMGCGNGAFIAYLNQQGFSHVSGYDPYFKEFSILDQSQKYNFVIANDVIEHVDHPKEFLNQCSELLVPKGILYIGTADSEDVQMNDLEKHVLKLHQPFHRIIMTQNTLENLGHEIATLELIQSYRRSYMDTLLPFINYRFLDEFNAILGYEMDLAFKPVSGKVFFKNPKLLYFGLFGYFFPSAAEPAILLKKIKGFG